MNDKQQYLLLRYSISEVPDVIEKHQEVINERGYCWFGKIGNIPSSWILNRVFEEEESYLLLYRKDAAFICKLLAYSTRKPLEGIPKYYDEEGIYPSIYFKLEYINPCDKALLHNSIVVSTGAYVEDVVFHSRIPFMLCMFVDESKLQPLGANDCRYKKDGFCTCRTCVNYECLCERPSSCAKQRR